MTAPTTAPVTAASRDLVGIPADTLKQLTRTRAREPQAVARAAAARTRRPLLGPDGRLLLIAADHPGRGALAVGSRPLAMADRADMLSRLRIALSRPGVDGVLGTPDVLDDLLLLGALEDKVVIGSMNRGGLAGSVFELDDRFTGYDAPALARAGFEGGKMLCRIDPADAGTVRTLESCAAAVSDLAAAGLLAMIEPFWSGRVAGAVHNDLSAAAVIRSVHVAQALGATSAYTWLKLPVVDGMDEVMAATTLPTLLLGGDPSGDPAVAFARWRSALALPAVCGLVVGRSLLYPGDGDVARAVDIAVEMVR